MSFWKRTVKPTDMVEISTILYSRTNLRYQTTLKELLEEFEK